MSKAKTISLSLIFQFIKIVVVGIVGILLVPLVIDIIGTSYYGELELLSSFMIISFFFELGMGSTLLRYIPVYKKEGYKFLNSFLWTYIDLKTLLAIFAALIILIIGVFFNQLFDIGKNDISIIRKSVDVFAIGILVTSFSSLIGNILKGFERFDYSLISEIISSLFLLGYIYVIKYLFTNINLIDISFAIFIVRPLVSLIIGVVLLKKTEPLISFKPQLPNKNYLKDSWGFLKGMSIIALFSQLSNRAPKVVLGIFLNPVYIAYWAIAEKLRNPIEQINSSLVRPLIPIGASLDLLNTDAVKSTVFSVTKVHSLIVNGIVTFVFLYINKFIYLWLGSNFLISVNLIKIWFIPFIIPNASILVMFYYAKGKTKLTTRVYSFTSIFGLLLGTLLLSKYGIIGFAAGLVLINVLGSFFLFYYLFKEFKINPGEFFKSVYFKTYSILLFVFFVNVLIKHFVIVVNTWSNFIIAIVIGTIIYVCLMPLAFTKKERTYIVNLIKDYF